MLRYLRIVTATTLWLIALAGLVISYEYRANLPPSGVQFIDEVPMPATVITPIAYISGAVSNPGIYRLSEGDRLADLVQRAGGLTETADMGRVNESLNFAEIVKDEQHVHIPEKAAHTRIPTSNSSLLVNINTATSLQLESLPAIGPATAEKIISSRPFDKIEDLLDVPGIGESTFEKLRGLITI